MTTPCRIPLFGGGSMGGALAQPEGGGPHPGMLVLHEVWGLNDDIRRIADRFVANGYVALAPDLYSHGMKALCLSRVLLDHQRGCRGATLDDIEAARAFLAAMPEVDGDRIAVVGFCLGGGFALTYGVKGDVRAAGVNYGRTPKERSELDGVCPVVASYGALDTVYTPQGERLERHLRELGVAHDVKTYPAVGHGFLGEGGPGWATKLPSPLHAGYSAEDAEDAWSRMLAFFARHVPST